MIEVLNNISSFALYSPRQTVGAYVTCTLLVVGTHTIFNGYQMRWGSQSFSPLSDREQYTHEEYYDLWVPIIALKKIELNLNWNFGAVK
jgi:hypothetical protein